MNDQDIRRMFNDAQPRVVYTEDQWQHKRARIRTMVYCAACVFAVVFAAAINLMVHT